MSFPKVLKCVLVTLSCVMLISAFAGSGIVPVQADPYYFTLHALATFDPFWGYYFLHETIWSAIKSDLAAIGINLEIYFVEDWELWDRVWGDGWNKSWDEGGWDMTIFEWIMQPHALAPWFESIVYGSLTPYEGGYNIFPWRNEIADTLLETGMRSFDADTRKTFLWLWQEQFMFDPPWVNLYYPRVYEVMADYIEGYDPVGWWYDVTHLYINETKFYEHVVTNPARLAEGPNTVISAVTEELWSLNPMFMDYRTEEQMGTLCFDTLYRWSIDPWPWPTGTEPNPQDYKILPELAADYPTWMDGPNGPNTRVRVPLRPGVVWSDGVPLNATDVKWTYDAMMSPVSKSTGAVDFTYVIESVEIVDEFTVDFILYEPYPDVLSVLSNGWGTGAILPWHHLKDVAPAHLRYHPSNTDFNIPANWMPTSGPFMWDPSDPPEPDVQITLIKNPSYYGYGLGWGPYDIDEIIMTWIPDPAVRLMAVMNNDVDLIERPIAPVETFQMLETWPNLRVFQYDRPASNPVWLNFDNPYLSNRYVRMAIANAIDYAYIINIILPSWGIETAYRGKTPILPQHYYDDGATTVHLFNEDLLPYEYNVAKALQYMEKWNYSQVGTDYTLGPVGDADFSGVVNLDDFTAWTGQWGQNEASFTFLPGQDKDSDFNNDDVVDLDDFQLWAANWGAQYPFPGAY